MTAWCGCGPRSRLASDDATPYERKDAFYRRAKAAGYRSRAAYKLLELQAKYRLLRRGDSVVELGCWPGGWLQVAAAAVGRGGRVVGIDRTPLEEPLSEPQIRFLQGDLADPDAAERILSALGRKAHVVLCDAAPKLTGVRATDRANEEALLAAVADLVPRLLRPGGHFAGKLLESPEANRAAKALGRSFEQARVHGLRATRKGSAERYLLGRGFRGEG